MEASRTTTALLVDDEPGSRRAQQTRLEDEGYNVVVAQDQAEALTRARQAAPKVIFIHLAATGPGNLGLIQALRSDDTFRHIPVVVIPNHLDAVAWRKKLRTVHRDVW